MTLWDTENHLFSQGYKTVCGVDEAGRGPLAGPVYAAAVILPPGLEIPGLDDSKKLSAKKRDALFDIIISSAVSYGIGCAGEEEIDSINILNATYLAMNRAISALDPAPDMSIIDGNRAAGIGYPSICLINGDALSASVAAASILAKVTRDRYMEKMAAEYPEYMFEKHKGYGTKLHYERIRALGPCPIHRKTFLKKLH